VARSFAFSKLDAAGRAGSREWGHFSIVSAFAGSSIALGFGA
jgi:hypothetical protein